MLNKCKGGREEREAGVLAEETRTKCNSDYVIVSGLNSFTIANSQLHSLPCLPNSKTQP